MTQPIARGYIRVSTVSQADDGISLETQKNRITEHCNYKRLKLVEFYIDAGISAKDSENRPELQRLLKEVQPGEYVVITELSRLSRNTKDSLNILESFKERGIFLVSLVPDLDFSTSVGTLVFTMLSAVAKMERENIAKHVTENLKRLKADNKLRGKPPFGYRFAGRDKDFEPDPAQQEVIQKIIKLFHEDPCITRTIQKLHTDGDQRVLKNGKLFTKYLIQTVLVDHGVLEPPKSLENRKTIEDRIVSHNKN